MTKHVAFSIACLAFAAQASAHPGHADPGTSWTLLHHLTEPVHLLAYAGAALLALAAPRMATRLRRFDWLRSR